MLYDVQHACAENVDHQRNLKLKEQGLYRIPGLSFDHTCSFSRIHDNKIAVPQRKQSAVFIRYKNKLLESSEFKQKKQQSTISELASISNLAATSASDCFYYDTIAVTKPTSILADAPCRKAFKIIFPKDHYNLNLHWSHTIRKKIIA